MYASMGPSNGNSHPVEFIIVDDKEKIEELSNMDSFATLVTNGWTVSGLKKEG